MSIANHEDIVAIHVTKTQRVSDDEAQLLLSEYIDRERTMSSTSTTAAAAAAPLLLPTAHQSHDYILEQLKRIQRDMLGLAPASDVQQAEIKADMNQSSKQHIRFDDQQPSSPRKRLSSESSSPSKKIKTQNEISSQA